MMVTFYAPRGRLEDVRKLSGAILIRAICDAMGCCLTGLNAAF